MDLETFKNLNLHVNFPRELTVNGRSNSELMNAINTPGDVHYHPCRESYFNEATDQGELYRFEDWSENTIFPQTNRNISVYVPKQADSNNPSNLIVFQDGDWYLEKTGPVRATAVLDTLIHRKVIPPTIAIFVMPGRPIGYPAPKPGEMPNAEARNQRSVEYDTCNGDYGSFLLEDVIPFVKKELGLNMATDPSKLILAGISSGGICAFNAAWHWPESFGNVLSHCGSYTNIRGGHNYPYLIRSTERKPIKVFLQSGELDANIIFGNWALANNEMASALEFAGYQYRFEFGKAGHSLSHGGAIFAESIRWLWPKQ